MYIIYKHILDLLVKNYTMHIKKVDVYRFRCVLIKLIQTDDVVDSTLARTWHSAEPYNRISVKLIHVSFAEVNISPSFLQYIQTSSSEYGANNLVDL